MMLPLFRAVHFLRRLNTLCLMLSIPPALIKLLKGEREGERRREMNEWICMQKSTRAMGAVGRQGAKNLSFVVLYRPLEALCWGRRKNALVINCQLGNPRPMLHFSLLSAWDFVLEGLCYFFVKDLWTPVLLPSLLCVLRMWEVWATLFV